jgi:hypothetical protein
MSVTRPRRECSNWFDRAIAIPSGALLLGLLTIGLLVCAWWVAVLIGFFSRQ